MHSYIPTRWTTQYTFRLILCVALALVGFPMLTCVSLAQQVSATRATLPGFEVVSVRERDGYDRASPLRLEWTQDGYIAEGIQLGWVMGEAYAIRPDLFVGMPKWTASKCFDIFAKVAPSDLDRFHNLSLGEKSTMLKQVLEDRFHAKAHVATRVSPAFDLFVARGGLKVSSTVKSTSLSQSADHTLTIGYGNLRAKNVSTAELAGALRNIVGRKVVDATNLSDRYTFTLKWSPEVNSTSAAQDLSSDPVIFVALREQLGLELRPSKAPDSYLVIDRIELPTPN